jgi:integrase
MRFPKVRAGPRPALGRAQAANLLRAVEGPVEVRLAYLGLYSGLRLAEICAVDAKGWKGSILEVRVKGGWIHRIPVHHELTRRRDLILADQPSRKQIQRACTRLRMHVDGLPMTPHWLRRTFSERMVELGIQRDVIGAILGHSARSILVAHYAPITWTEMARDTNRLHYQKGRAA